jgi:hypothetical protein
MSTDMSTDTFRTEMLRAGMNAIREPDEGLLPVEMVAIDAICDDVLARDVDAAWHRAAAASKQILRDHSEAVKAEFIAAYAELPPMA